MTTISKLNDECASVSEYYFGNGTQKIFTFNFPYMSWEDVLGFILDDSGRWVLQETGRYMIQATGNTQAVEFVRTPPAPQDPTVPNVWITRRTDLESMLSIFQPGSAIRAKDLNNDFDQLRLAIQEGRCSLEDLKGQLQDTRPVFDRADQESGLWSGNGDQDYLATSGAIAAREDTIVGENLPPTITFQQPGKGWMNTDDCWSSYWNIEANAWVAYVNTGPRGVPGIQGPIGPKGDDGTGLNVSGYINQPGPPDFDGTAEGDFVIDSNGDGWFWETDTDPNQWINTGSIQGPEGPPGPSGDAATITVDSTITGVPGTDASVVNVGSISEASLVFTIPRGERGEPGQNGTGAGTVTEIIVAKPLIVSNAQGPVVSIGFDISTLDVLP